MDTAGWSIYGSLLLFGMLRVASTLATLRRSERLTYWEDP
jgi:hypothetical protein